MRGDVAKIAMLFTELDIPWDFDGEFFRGAGRIFKINYRGELIEVVNAGA